MCMNIGWLFVWLGLLSVLCNSCAHLHYCYLFTFLTVSIQPVNVLNPPARHHIVFDIKTTMTTQQCFVPEQSFWNAGDIHTNSHLPAQK